MQTKIAITWPIFKILQICVVYIGPHDDEFTFALIRLKAFVK